ncbi:MAG: hypothetical protein ABSC34_08690 [Acidimicrobiales bacterium]|jgi:hypothetical protein
MAAMRIEQMNSDETPSRPHLRLVRVETLPELRRGRPLGERRAARARMMKRRRRTLVLLALLAGLVILSLQGVAFGGIASAGLSSDLSNGAVLAPGMSYVVQPGDTLHSIASMVDPSNPARERVALERELGSTVVVTGEHVLIP